MAARQVPDEVREDVAATARANNQFAFDVYGQLGDGNVFLSPFSISTALAMLDAGAVGDTDAEIRAALHLDLPGERAHEAYGALLDSIAIGRDFGAYTLTTANRLFGQKGFAFLPSYLETIADDYGAELEELDFAADPEKARRRANQWVSGETDEKIPELFQKGAFSAASRMAFANAILFKGLWADPFDQRGTEPGDFYLADGTVATTDMMSRMGGLDLAGIEGGMLGVLPFQGNDLSMVLLVPGELDGLPAIEAQLTPEVLDRWIQSARPSDEKTMVSFPKFELEQSIDLEAILARLGIVSAFAAADFSGMTGGRDLALNSIVHQAVISVDEKGAEAAAATGGDVDVSAGPELTVDRPFVFLIYDQVTGSILFMGRLADPTAS